METSATTNTQFAKTYFATDIVRENTCFGLRAQWVEDSRLGFELLRPTKNKNRSDSVCGNASNPQTRFRTQPRRNCPSTDSTSFSLLARARQGSAKPQPAFAYGFWGSRIEGFEGLGPRGFLWFRFWDYRELLSPYHKQASGLFALLASEGSTTPGYRIRA